MEHWHIDRKTDEDSEMAFTTIYAALEALETEVRDRADFHYQGISANGDTGCYELAYQDFQAWATYDNALSNMQNVSRQHSLPATSPDRAPLYRADIRPTYAEQSKAEVEARLLETAKWVAEQVNSGTIFEVWPCSQDDVIVVTEDEPRDYDTRTPMYY